MTNQKLASGFMRWLRPGLTTLLVALALGSVLFWLMQVSSVPRAASELRLVDTPVSSAGAAGLDHALGVVPEAANSKTSAATSPTSLLLAAVIARGGSQGSALIAVNGQKAQIFRTGDEVHPGLYLIQVGLRSASLAATPEGPQTQLLTIEPPALPAVPEVAVLPGLPTLPAAPARVGP